MDERTRRIGLNEAVFRQVNEKLDDLNAAFGQLTNVVEIVCECGNGGCAEQITLTRDAYAEIRSDATLFVIRPGHEIRSTEEVVRREDTHEVVRKDPGAPAELARATAPTR